MQQFDVKTAIWRHGKCYAKYMTKTENVVIYNVGLIVSIEHQHDHLLFRSKALV